MNASWIEGLTSATGLRVVYQPIIEVRDARTSVHSLECLTRGPEGSLLESPTSLFAHARRIGLEPELDRACIRAALEGAATLPPVRLSVNVHASTLSKARGFPYFLLGVCAKTNIDWTRLTVEIVETTRPHDVDAFRRSLEELRTAGIRIALDDLGSGYSNYRMVVDTHPDYFKVDRYFVTGSKDDAYRMAILESVALLAKRTGARAVVEGVETREALHAVIGAGIDLIQGYLFAQPMCAEAIRDHLASRTAEVP